MFRSKCTIRSKDLHVYCIVGDREKKVLDTDLYRIYWLRDHGYDPYVMIYEKYELPKKHELKQFQRYVNSKAIFYTISSFEEYKNKKY